MQVFGCKCSGRADPLGLLVLAVVLALTITIGLQAQANLRNGGNPALGACDAPCVTVDMRH